MDWSSRVLGVNIATQLQERVTAPVLKIGRDTFTRGDLAGVSCFNYHAAANLTAVLSSLGVESTKDVYDSVGPHSLALPHLGAISLAVLGAAFECKHLGGGRPLESWVIKHRAPDASREFVTFHTIKIHSAEAVAAKRERRATKGRQLARRARAHRLRVDRHIARNEKPS